MEKVTEPFEAPSRLLKALNGAKSKHLTYAQLEGFVDSRLESTEGEFVRAHLELCSQCEREMQDLRWFSESSHYRDEIAAAAASPSKRPGFWEVVGQWFKVPRHGLITAGAAMAMAVIVAILTKLHGPSPSSPTIASHATPASSPTTAVAPQSEVAVAPPKPESNSEAPAKPEAVLEAPSSALGAVGSRQPSFGPRVLSPVEAYAYRDELGQAPNDPETRAEIAIKYGLYSEAEKEYRKMQAAGGEQAEKARQLLAKLKRLRGH